MIIWHGESDTPAPAQPRAGHPISINVGTSPVAPGQGVRVHYRIRSRGGDLSAETTSNASWVENRDDKSFWRAELGLFKRGDCVEYRLVGKSEGDKTTEAPGGVFEVAPRLWLALLWHQHQPLYRDLARAEPRGAYLKPWVRLHAIRDYYSMAALIAEQPGIRVTINLTPVLLRQIEEYAHSGATDRALELTLKPANTLSLDEREEILRTFFDADWHNQIFVHPRYRELFARRSAQESFTDQDLRDLQMWFSLAWFGKEFREGEIPLVTGEVASVRRFVEHGLNFTDANIGEMVEEQLKILRAILPLHRGLQDAGVVEVSTTPFYHPILPLLVDTDRATLDRAGSNFPPRFSHPEDADAQVRLAVDLYRELFGQAPRGMWPAEGAVAEFVLPLFARHGVRWLATDQGVLARSGKWGYRADLPEVLCRPYRAEGVDSDLSLFFRATPPSDDIGFHFQTAPDYEGVVRAFLDRLKAEYGAGPDGEERVLTLALDGENAWGAYRDDGRAFLRALYRSLAEDSEIQTTTFSGYLDRRSATGLTEPIAHELFTGSWIDEMGSAPGVDLGTWIGHAEKNHGWELLGKVRAALATTGSGELAPAALHALYAAEGSDWFWWFGDNQDSGSDQEFDDLSRTHLRSALILANRPVIPELGVHIVPHAVVWTFSEQAEMVRSTDRLVVRTNCAGRLEWWQSGSHHADDLVPVNGVMAGVHRFERSLGPFPKGAGEITFRFECYHSNCPGGPCCQGRTHHVRIG